MTIENMSIDDLCVNTLRTLSADMVTTANSGHPGAPLGCAAMAYALYARALKHNPASPSWPDRDRFVLSAGHASALLYSALHLSGYALPLDELKKFRQLGSMTPGHPEYGDTPGVETTSGPLGQGLATAVGMAIAERYLAAHFNRPGHEVVDHNTYVIAGDGDMMEGISHEAAGLAGHLQLGKLVVLYDDNNISLEGPTAESFTDDTEARFRAYGWHVLKVAEASTDVDAVCAAIDAAKTETGKPTLIMCRTHIGFGSDVQDTSAAHGKPLSTDQLADLKRTLGWPDDAMFLVPEQATAHMAACTQKGAQAEQAWNDAMESYAAAHPELAAALRSALAGELPEGWDAALPVWTTEDAAIATRSAAGNALNAIRANCALIVGGAADVASSTNTMPTDKTFMQAGAWDNPNVRFGVREFAMSAACNGIALHGGLRGLGSTFLVFADYCRPALRLAALMGLPTIHQFTHDSIGLGEDGPTHQPIEQVASLRVIPNFTVIRPADANEAAEAWRAALLNTAGPTAIIGSRQSLPILPRTESCPAALVHMGAYVLRNCDGTPDVLLMASGSEVELTLRVADELATDGIKSRVVSFPSWELFDKQDPDWRDAVLPPSLTTRMAIEAGSAQGWHKYVGSAGDIVALDRFGASGPGPEVYAELGFSVEEIVARAKALLAE